MKRKESLSQLYKTYVRSFSSNPTPISEINIEEIKELVNDRCKENNLAVLNKIYGFENGCPVCTSNYTNKNWIVLHPCGHLLCSDCLSGLNQIVQRDGIPRKCPMCRRRCKWIGDKEDNLRTISSTPNSYGGGNIPRTPTPFSNMFGSSRPNRRRFMVIDEDEEDDNKEETIIPSLPPISIENEEKKLDLEDLTCEISNVFINLDNKEQKIGNLSIRAKDLNQSDKGIDLVIVMDVSGSMSPVAKDCISILKESIKSLSRLDRLSIIVFDNNSHQLFALQPMINEIKRDCINKVETCFSGGSTNFESAIKLMIKVKEDGIREDRSFKIIFLSDGQPDSGCEGFETIKEIYKSNPLPELYACTFGKDVKADVLQKLLRDGGMDYYRHISDSSAFKELIKEIGLDKNIEIGKNIKIVLTKISPETSLPFQKEADKNIIKIDRIRTGEILSFPFIYPEGGQIEIEYQNLEDERKYLEINEIDIEGDFIKNHFWYRRITRMIKEINIQTENGLEKINEISYMSSPDKLGPFRDEIKRLLTEARNMLTIHNQGYHHYNTYTSSVQRTTSYSSPIIGDVYRNVTPTRR